MDDTVIQAHLDDLLAEVDTLRAGPADGSTADRLTDLAEQVQQSRDLLQQRRTRRELGEDPGLVEAPPAD